jgi:hypothetical protein
VQTDTRMVIVGRRKVVSDTNDASVYELIQLMSSLNDTRRAILLALAHIYPRSVSGVQLSRLIGYSGKSRSLYRGVISHLKENEMIQIDQLTPKLYAIRINNEHPLLTILVDLCKDHGKYSRKVYLKALEEE